MEDSLDVESMRTILSYSYYDLPPQLRTCLLYLSIFPEDFEIGKNRLIWMWRAEGFIQYEKQRRKSLSEIGESYFNELINRSMIQPIYYDEFNGPFCSCRVHDMVFDLLRSISSDENFVTILSGMDEASSSRKVRRLSLQNNKTNHAMPHATENMLSVRSVIVFPSTFDQMPTLQFKVLRVLDLEGDLSNGCSLQYLGSLFHLRYLNLKGTYISELPETIANLKFLEVLNLRYTNIWQLPRCVAQLTHLRCLTADSITSINSEIGGLTSLEELNTLWIDDNSADTIQGLGLLTELRVLGLYFTTEKYNDKVVESLCKLQKVQSIILEGNINLNGLDAWVHPQLRQLTTDDESPCWFSTLPTWLNNPMQFQDLGCLWIAIRELQQKDLDILGRLPALRDLSLNVDHEALGIVERMFVIGAGWFPCLVKCKLRGIIWPVMFHQEAMPRLSLLEFRFSMHKDRENACSDGSFDCGLGNLLMLQKVRIFIWVRGKDEVQGAEAAMRHAVEVHPNRPCIEIKKWF